MKILTMRLSSYLWAVVLISLIAGCKKNADRDIENPGISFLYGANSKNDFILQPSSSPQKVTNLLLVNLRSANPAKSDISITIADNTPLLLNAYNAANNTSIEPLPKAIWSMPSELVIKKDSQYTKGEITVSNTSSLDLSKQYAIGIAITGVNNGNKLADNLGNLFIVFKIQNVWDGKYRMKGQFYDPILEPSFAHHDFLVEFHTAGSNSVMLYWPPTAQYLFPLTTNGGQPWYFSNPNLYNQLLVIVNTSNNLLNAVNTGIGGVAGPYNQISGCNGNTYNTRWDPSNRTFFLAFAYGPTPGGVFTPGPNSGSAWLDTLTYLGPR